MCYWQMFSFLIDIKNFQYGFCWWWSYNCIVCNRILRNNFFIWTYIQITDVWTYESLLMYSSITKTHAWTYERVFICCIHEYVNICSYVVYDFGCMQFNCGTPQDLSYWEYFSILLRSMLVSTMGRQNKCICTRLQTNAKKRQNTHIIKSCIFACMLVCPS